MNQLLSNTCPPLKAGFLFLLGFMLLSFQRGNTQHCTPGFHFSVNGNTVVFEDLSTSDGTITSYQWSFGDGGTSSDQNPTYTYASPGTYNVCLTITAHNPNCSATYCHHVVILHAPPGECHAAFAAHQPDPSHPTINFTDQSTSDGTIGSWLWDFGDGQTSTDQNPSHTYASPGTYLVCLFITDADGGCTSHFCTPVVVHHPPVDECHAAFTVQINGGLGLQLTNASTGVTNNTTYLWDFGDGTTSTEENPLHLYPHYGHYTACLFITDTTTGCTSHICHTVYVHHGGMFNHHILEPQLEITNGPNGEYMGERSTEPFELMCIYPNPAISEVRIVFQQSMPALVSMEMFTLTGLKVMTVVEIRQPAGEQVAVIPLDNLKAGVYMLRITVDGKPQTHRITIL